MNIPSRFTTKAPSESSPIYLVERQSDGNCLISWPKAYTDDEGQCIYPSETVERLVQCGTWPILSDLTIKAPTFAEKCQQLELSIFFHKDYISLSSVSVATTEDLEKLVNLLYDARR